MDPVHLFEIIRISSFEEGLIHSCMDTTYYVSFYLE